jgi:hypothetical protein
VHDVILDENANFVGIENAINDLFKVLKIRKSQKEIEQLTDLEQETLHTIKLTTFFG